MSESIYRTIFSADQLETQVATTLRLWLPQYIKEIEDQRGREVGLIPPPRTYTRRNEFQSFPDDQLPFCIVVSPGLVEPPVADGEGRYRGWWGVGVGVVAAASTEEDTNALVKIYGAAVRAVMLQQPDLGGSESQGVEWEDERYDDNLALTDQRRSVGAARVVFRVWVDDVVSRWNGPTTPDPGDWPPGSVWGTVEHVIISDTDENVIVEVP